MVESPDCDLSDFCDSRDETKESSRVAKITVRTAQGKTGKN
jgi:hypothetical protein